ncbi:MAG: VWA domain-containing protein [Spirochaetes bacterium]|nr:VWA domain-containing protein [Spirochaetota bacterium]
MRVLQLLNPSGLLYLIFPFLCLLVIILSRFLFKKGVKVSGSVNIRQKISFSVLGYYLSQSLILAGLFLLAFSLAKPQYGIQREKIISEGIDIMISLDVSGSMLHGKSAKNSRIEVAKDILIDFIKKRKGDRIGLVSFSTNSLLRCPATLNYELLINLISRITIDPERNNLTAIGLGLASAINRLIHLEDNARLDSKIIILLTDGVNNTGEITPDTATVIAEKMGIKIYTVGIGSVEEIDTHLLEYIALKTNGKFYHAQSLNDLSDIFTEIDQLEKIKIETIQLTRFKSIGYYFVVWGLLFLFIGILLLSFFFKRLG